MNFSKSEELFERAQRSIPGGVNSPVRAFKSVGGKPVFFERAKGAYLYDADGQAYIDFVNSWGPMILGQGREDILNAVQDRMSKGLTFGAPTAIEIELAELIKSMVPGLDLIRMVNSGTEACMSAIRLARGYTGKSKIIKFAGCYHGHADSFLIKAGSGAVTLGTPDSPGVTPGTAADTLIAEYNNLESVRKQVEDHGSDLAAIILEPVAGNMGCIPPSKEFLQGLREIADQQGAVLIFDEVMTGFRLAKGGAQEAYGIQADLVTYGKVIGGGMPVGAFGGKREIMEKISPLGPVYQAGTLSGNPLAMACGLATLGILNEQPEIYQKLENTGAKLESGLREALEPLEFTINRKGSMISVHFGSHSVLDFDSAAKANNDRFKRFFHFMLNHGVYLPPSAFETWFISEAIGENEIQKTLDLVGEFARLETAIA